MSGKPDDAGVDPGTERVSFDRLRERTDELELIISGLSLFALLSIPGALWGVYEQYYGRLPLGLAAIAAIALPVVNAICYSMVAVLVMHLAVRAHWVGLIGLKAVFPAGIRWERIGGIGPVTLDQQQRRDLGIERSIARADALASTLFSLITYTAIALAVLGLWMGLIFAVASLAGDHLGGTNNVINQWVPWLFLAYLGAPVLRWLFDGVLSRLLPRFAQVKVLRFVVLVLVRIEGLFLPPSLLATTRLTLQSHLLPRSFLALFLLVVIALLWVSSQFGRETGFDVLRSQQFVSGRATGAGMRSGYYETQRIGRDRMRLLPVIPAPVVETAWLPLFLPYVALIDDPVLAQRCTPQAAPAAAQGAFASSDSDAEALQRESEADAVAAATVECLNRLWEVRLDGELQDLSDFVPAERADLGLRGLSGWIPLHGDAGPRRLVVIWRPQPEQDQIAQDYVPKRIRHVIPFLWSPENAATPP